MCACRFMCVRMCMGVHLCACVYMYVQNVYFTFVCIYVCIRMFNSV